MVKKKRMFDIDGLIPTYRRRFHDGQIWRTEVLRQGHKKASVHKVTSQQNDEWVYTIHT